MSFSNGRAGGREFDFLSTSDSACGVAAGAGFFQAGQAAEGAILMRRVLVIDAEAVSAERIDGRHRRRTFGIAAT